MTLDSWAIIKYKQSSLWRLAEKWQEGNTSIISPSNSSSLDERNPSQFCTTDPEHISSNQNAKMN